MIAGTHPHSHTVANVVVVGNAWHWFTVIDNHSAAFN